MMTKNVLITYLMCIVVGIFASPVEAQELSSKEKKIVEQYNQYVEKARRDDNEYSLPLCEFAGWYSNSPQEPECTSFWTGWCWASKQPSIRVYDKPNGVFVNALRGGRLLKPEERTGEEVPVYFLGELGKEKRWVQVFGPYKNEYRYWGWVDRRDIDCEA